MHFNQATTLTLLLAGPQVKGKVTYLPVNHSSSSSPFIFFCAHVKQSHDEGGVAESGMLTHRVWNQLSHLSHAMNRNPSSRLAWHTHLMVQVSVPPICCTRGLLSTPEPTRQHDQSPGACVFHLALPYHVILSLIAMITTYCACAKLSTIPLRPLRHTTKCQNY